VRSFRFLLSRRWILFALAVAVLGYGTWWLGNWQLGKLHHTQRQDVVLRANLAAPPVPVQQLLKVGTPLGSHQEWRRVTATGSYDTEDAVTLLYQTNDDSVSGIHELMPFDTVVDGKPGPVLIVDRGWLASDNQINAPVQLPAPPSGTVTITGWARINASGSSTDVDDSGAAGLTTRSISSTAIGAAIHQPVYDAFVNLQSESPRPAKVLGRPDMPSFGDKAMYFFYWLQWWFFGVLALFGFFFLLWDERRSTMTTTEGELTDTALEHLAVKDVRKRRRDARNARKQALHAAYQAAHQADAEHRTKAFGGTSNPHLREQAAGKE